MKRMWVRLSIIYTVIIFLVALLLMVLVLFIQPDAQRLAQQTNLVGADREVFLELVESGALENAIRTAIFSQILGLFVLAIVAGVMTSAWASWLITRPLSVLSEAIRKVSNQDFTKTVDIQGTHEVESLANSFNLMVSELASAEERRQNLLADVAHELRTPLTVLQGNLRGTLDNVYTLDQEKIAILYNQTRQLNYLIDDLHDLAQAEANRLEMTMIGLQLDEIVTQAVELFAPLALESDIILSADIAPNLPIIRGDKKRLMQVLQNLIANALRYAKSSIQVKLDSDDAHLTLSIIDDGIGISEDDLTHIFDRFYRADKSRTRASGGTGLGLAIVKSIVHAHNGTINVQSDIGKGASFIITLPI